MGDFFTELPIRILGYGYAIGEALLYVSSLNTVDACYTIGTGFMIIHVVHATITKSHGEPVKSFFYAILWEGFASAIIPTFLVYWTCRLTFRFLANHDFRPYWLRRWTPTMMGFLIMPFIMMNLDPAMDSFLNDVL